MTKVILTDAAHKKLFGYIDQCDLEIGGLGKMRVEDGNFVVHDVEIFDQEVTSSHVDMTAATLAKFQTRKHKEKESIKEYTFWWHSHAKMDAFFSGVDEATIRSSTEFPYLVSLVSNHAHKMVARFDIYSPIHVTCPLTVEVEDAQDPAIRAGCLADIEKYVKRKTYTYTGGGTGDRRAGFGAHGGDVRGSGRDGFASTRSLIDDDAYYERRYGEGATALLLPYGASLDSELSEEEQQAQKQLDALLAKLSRITDHYERECMEHGADTKKAKKLADAWLETDAAATTLAERYNLDIHADPNPIS